MDKRPLQNTVSSKSLRIQAFEGLDAFKIYYAIGAAVSSLHRESTDSVIYKPVLYILGNAPYCIVHERRWFVGRKMVIVGQASHT